MFSAWLDPLLRKGDSLPLPSRERPPLDFLSFLSFPGVFLSTRRENRLIPSSQQGENNRKKIKDSLPRPCSGQGQKERKKKSTKKHKKKKNKKKKQKKYIVQNQIPVPPAKRPRSIIGERQIQ
jgi:hypothetical protein